jgi:hypothetical protein
VCLTAAMTDQTKRWLLRSYVNSRGPRDLGPTDLYLAVYKEFANDSATLKWRRLKSCCCLSRTHCSPIAPVAVSLAPTAAHQHPIPTPPPTTTRDVRTPISSKLCFPDNRPPSVFQLLYNRKFTNSAAAPRSEQRWAEIHFHFFRCRSE